MNFFPSKTHISTSFGTRYVYGLLFTKINIFYDVNVGKNILMNSQLKKNAFYEQWMKQNWLEQWSKWSETEKYTKNMVKENNTDESNFSEN